MSDSETSKVVGNQAANDMYYDDYRKVARIRNSRSVYRDSLIKIVNEESINVPKRFSTEDALAF